MDILRYAQAYDTSGFYSDGMDWQRWQQRKEATFTMYDTISVAVDDLRVTELTESTAVVKFLQTYRSNLNTWVNAKQLSLRKIDNSWRIFLETTLSNEELL
jgi:hypothetical protein